MTLVSIQAKNSVLPIKFKYSRAQHGPIYLLLFVALLLLLFCLPLLYVLLQASETGWTESWRLLMRPRVFELLRNTLLLDTTVTISSVIVGVSVAWCIERTNLPGRKIWNVLVTLPLAVPAFVSGYSWISVLPSIEGFLGAWLVLTFSYYPLVHLPVAAAFRNMDPALEETSRSLGYGRLTTFIRVTSADTSLSFTLLASSCWAVVSLSNRWVAEVKKSGSLLPGSKGGCPPAGEARTISAPASLSA